MRELRTQLFLILIITICIFISVLFLQKYFVINEGFGETTKPATRTPTSMATTDPNIIVVQQGNTTDITGLETDGTKALERSNQLDELYNGFLEILNTQMYKKLEIGDCVVGDIGSKYNAKIITSNVGDQYINFSVPQGPIGANGQKGPQGSKGPTGKKGPPGSVGPSGAPC